MLKCEVSSVRTSLRTSTFDFLTYDDSHGDAVLVWLRILPLLPNARVRNLHEHVRRFVRLGLHVNGLFGTGRHEYRGRFHICESDDVDVAIRELMGFVAAEPALGEERRVPKTW